MLLLLLLRVPADELLAVVGLDDSLLDTVAVVVVMDVEDTSVTTVAPVEEPEAEAAAAVAVAPTGANGTACAVFTGTAAISLPNGWGACAG